MLKRDLTPMDAEAVMPVADSARRIRARRPNDVWHADLTVVPTAAGLWIPGSPHARIQRWPFCWWVAVAVDHASRKLVGIEVFKRRPTSAQVCSVLSGAIRRAGVTPRTIVTDKGREFFCWQFRSWCQARGIRPRFGAVGQHGSITIVERFIRSLKSECTRRILVPFRIEAMRRELEHYAAWYDEHRPHSGLEGRTPGEVSRGEPAATERPRFEPRRRWPNAVGEIRGRRGARLKLVLTYVGGRRHLPVVELEQAA